MTDFTTVATLDDLPPDTLKEVTVGGEKVCLANIGGTIHAIGGTCTHAGGPLAEGVLDDGRIVCPWHGAQFDPATGEPVALPARRKVPCYRVQVEGNDIRIAPPE